MATLIFVLITLQALGAVVGAVSAVWGEIAYITAMRDDKIDHAEMLHLRSIAAGLRVGMLLLLLSSLGLVIAAYLLDSRPQPVMSPSYWILMTLALLIVWGTWALSRKRVRFSYGSALVFTGWWFLAYLTLGWLPGLSYGSAVAAFVVIGVLFYALLQSGRAVVAHRRRIHRAR